MFKLSDLVQKGRAVALGLDMANAGNLQQLLHGAGPLRGHIQKRCVGKHDIGRDALLLRDAEAKRLQRGQKRLVRPGRSCFFLRSRPRS